MKKQIIALILFIITITACTSSAAEMNPTPNVAVTNSPASSNQADCHKIAFAMFNFKTKVLPDIYTICPDGSNMTRLTDHPNADETPVWSPDGQLLAFISNRTGSYHLYLMDENGGNLTQVTEDYDNSLPVWLPDGQRIAFRTTDNQGVWWWRSAKLDGSEIENITEPSYDFFYQTPAWSPDGTKIATMSLEEQKERNDGSSQIHVKEIDGSYDLALTQNSYENASPIWSPDGKKIAFLSEMHGEPNIFALYVMRANGSDVKQLSKPIYTDVSAVFSWSPDGKQIAIGDINIGRIFLIDVADGKSDELFFLKEGESIYSPSWQP